MAQYRTIHTSYGLTRMIESEALGVPINLTHMAVGDGAGNPVTPSTNMTQLVRELYRAPVNRVYRDPATPTKFIAELVVPAAVGGFTLREVGVFDAQGGLFVVGNLPPIYKPRAIEGAYGDTVVRVEFLATNADVVALQIDPNVAVVTQTWIANNVTAANLIPGGTAGQVLTKRTNADGDVQWRDPADANVVVAVIEDKQELADGQTVVTLVNTTTSGLAVYVNGERLSRGPGANEWQPDPAEPTTQVLLGQAYPAGSVFLAVQNEPAGSVPTPLERSKNFADLENVATARANLDVYSKMEVDAMVPPGTIAFFARNSAPPGWLKCNGAAVSRTAYARLFAAIGTTFGPGDGFNTFNLPDLRGEFVRGWDDGRGVDPGRVFGSRQTDQLRAHTHTVAAGSREGDNLANFTHGGSTDSPAVSTSSTGGSETRPRNIALLACIRY